MKKDLEILISKYLRHELEAAEQEELEVLLEHPENLQEFNSQVELEFLLQKDKKEFHAVQGYSKIEKNLGSEKSLNWKIWLKYAAILVLLMAMTFFLNEQTTVTAIPETNVVYIEEGNGNIKILEMEGEKQITNKKGEVIATKIANKIIYKELPEATELEYNTITVPYGSLFQIVLSDGTEVELNAGTEFSYPVQFINGEDRQVFLKGEGFFKVSTDSLHPFKVNTGDFHISVLGTQFNISAYEDDQISSAVLTEGSIMLNNKNFFQLLHPGEMASITNSEAAITVEKVNIRKHIAWKEGIVIFQNETFEKITKTLERTYNVKIENKVPELKQEVFTATFVDEDIEQILALFSKSRPFKYKINAGKVTIEKK
ncbi:FecR domain-containing protein [Salinimicrobium sp. TIG7-5_MAKvit]|uniref:FecR family protein n=1 Tax=Salinimicrobium sp. TIG7-5_MAKvit TaxID=3121289 RepID=UPI003C6E216C